MGPGKSGGMDERAADKGSCGREDSGNLRGGGGSSPPPATGSNPPSDGMPPSSSCGPVVITADLPPPATARASPQVGAPGTAVARRSAATSVSSRRGRSRGSSNSSHQPARRAPRALRGQHQLHRQHQATAPIEVSPGDDDVKSDNPPGRKGRDGSEDECGMIRGAATTASLEVSGNRTRGREAERRGDHGEEDESGDRPSPSCSFHLVGSRCLDLVGLGDLPDSALARTFFSGFLDSLEVASSLRLVSRRMMAIASTACQVMDLHGISLCDQDLGNVAASFPRLVHVDLSFCKSLGEGISTSLRPCQPTLQTLSLRGMGVSSSVVEGLRQFRQLTSLDISQSVEKDSRKVASASLIGGLPGLRRLTKLSLAWNKGVTDAVVEQLCIGAKGLVELDLGLCTEITLGSIQVLSAQRFLRVLSLRACVHVSDDVVRELVTACPGLSSLDLAHLPLLTGKSLRSLVSLRDLKKLDLRCCELLTTADVVAFRTFRPLTRVAELRAWWP